MVRLDAGGPRLSLGERERRFSLVRSRMRERDLKAIIIRCDSSRWDSGSSEARYLTQIGGNGEEGYAVFDLEHDPLFVVWAPAHVANWRDAQDWTSDIRAAVPSAEAVLTSRLSELGLGEARIGLVGMGGSVGVYRQGKWPHSSYEALHRLLPKAQYVDFTADFDDLRMIKSAEEIACIEHAAAGADAAVDAITRYAKPGARAHDVVGKMADAMIAAGGEMPPMLLLDAGPKPRHSARIVPHRVLEAGDVILAAFGTKCHGYWAEFLRSVCVGRRPDAGWQRLFDAAAAGIRAGEALLRPGASMRDLAAAVRAPVTEAGCITMLPPVHGVGLTISEVPSPPPPNAEGPGVIIQENMVIAFEAMAHDPKADRSVILGDLYAVTATGHRRLGTRPLEFSAT